MAFSVLARETTDLSGQWQFWRDDDKTGMSEQRFAAPLPGDAAIKLPGTMDEARLGIDNPKKPSLDDLWRPNIYEGAAWYQRRIEIPESWRGRRVTLFLERCRWLTQAWLDGQPCGGALDSLIAPHVHELGMGLAPGQHTLTLLVDNTKRIDLGPFVSALYGGTQGNLNGIAGKIELRATRPVWIDSLQVYPQLARRTLLIRAKIGNATGQAGSGTLKVGITPALAARSFPVSWAIDGGAIETELPVWDAKNPLQLWDEFSPNLYELEASLDNSESARVSFGFRELDRRGTQFTMNGRPLFLRGTLECQVFPLTGCPPCDVASWQRIFQIEKSYGLNFIRFHSWCPPEAAFAAADIEGVMIQAEAPQANVQAGSDPTRDAFTRAELLRMVRSYGNHPSFCLMTLGNEYGGKDEVLSGWIDMLVKEDPRHLYSSASAGQRTANRQWTEDTFGRGVRGPGTAHDVGGAVEHESVPPVGHEIGQWVFFPDFNEMKKYTGVMQAKNFEIIRDSLQAEGMLGLAPRFVQATGRQAVLLYKEEIELLLRTRGLAGFSLLDLHDYPSQGTATVGLLDPFWDSKGFIDPAEHQRYCGPTVPLLRMPKRTYTADEMFSAAVEVANYGPRDLEGVRPLWRITGDRGRKIANGVLETRTIPTGQLTPLGSIRAPLADASAPCKLTVTVGLQGTKFANSWNIWVYPAASDEPQLPAGVVVSGTWDEAAKAALADGKTVLLTATNKTIQNSLAGSFLPTFWSPVWFPTQKPDTMSILCDSRHPLFALFPTGFYSDWQWYDLMQNSRSLILDKTPANFRPLVRVIDNFARNHKLGSVFEARFGQGKLLVCSIDLAQSKNIPAMRQFARSLYAYLASPGFKPKQELSASLLDDLFAPSQKASVLAKLGATIVRTDSETPDHQAANVLDDDPDSFWHTAWEPSPKPMPHEIIIDIGKPIALRGVTYLPRQDMANGRIADYEIYASLSLENWNAPIAKGTWPDSADKQTVTLNHAVTARYLRVVAKSEVHANAFASAAEFDIELAK